MPDPRDAVITGIGLVSCLGEGQDAHWAALNAPGGFQPVTVAGPLREYPVHPTPKLELSRQIPKHGDQRQMEPWQRIGTYAAGLALDAAGVKGVAELLARTDLIVAAGGGERDYAVDAAILSALPASNEPEVLLNERLLGDLRPTLFLAQLSNLLAGNISIVHGVIGSSRTFMGEEASGADAVRIACARIAAGQAELCLVGSSYNAERPDAQLHYLMGGKLHRGPFTGIWNRAAGLILGSVGCFLVIESREHAHARGAQPIAHIAAIATDRCSRAPNAARAIAEQQLAGMRQHLQPGATAVFSANAGVAPAMSEEAQFLAGLDMPVRGVANALGHSIEAAFPAALALAAMALQRQELFAPLQDHPLEAPMQAPLASALVTGWGHWRGEAMAVSTPP
jgi:3-oxoacyl-[acyl-carrier-protein] synthase II